MLTSIKKLKGFGVFGNYLGANDLTNFARLNVVYGENGSGKTTLSRFFAVLGKGEHPDHPELEYAISTDTGPMTNGKAMPRKVRVFNAEYVEENLGKFDGPVRPILIVGKENRALAEEVAAERSLHQKRSERILAAQDAHSALISNKAKVFSLIAKTIGEATSGSTLRQYRKPDAESAFELMSAPNLLSDEDLEVARATVHQEQLDAVAGTTLPAIDVDLASRIKALLARTAQSGAIATLSSAPEIAAWLEEGLALHRHGASETCAFCNQPMPLGRLDELARHFGVEDQRLKRDIETMLAEIEAFSQGLQAVGRPAPTALYSELRDAYAAVTSAFDDSRAGLLAQLSESTLALRAKLLERSRSIETEIVIELGILMQATRQLQELLDRHNEKTRGFEERKKEARASVESHYLSTVWEQIHDLQKQIEEQASLVRGLIDGSAGETDKRSIVELKASIEAKQAKVSSAHVGGAELTEKLCAFLGRSDLELQSGADGYRVLRRGQPARRLSEGEKTAIAFLHFIVRLGDQDFTLSDGVVVIDDPVSSLDSSAMYQAFGFLKNAVKDAKQVFLLTHNFEFLQLLLNWLRNMRKDQRSFYMVVCHEEADGRAARIEPLDKLLMEHATEYHYLFKLLYGFKSDGTILAAYHIPNVARKVLETFLEFHVPSNGSLYEKMEAIDFDDQKKTAIYKFANDLSHATGKGFDPALVSEAQKNVSALLEMIRRIAPAHYDGLVKLCGGTSPPAVAA